MRRTSLRAYVFQKGVSPEAPLFYLRRRKFKIYLFCQKTGLCNQNATICVLYPIKWGFGVGSSPTAGIKIGNQLFKPDSRFFLYLRAFLSLKKSGENREKSEKTDNFRLLCNQNATKILKKIIKMLIKLFLLLLFHIGQCRPIVLFHDMIGLPASHFHNVLIRDPQSVGNTDIVVPE